MNLFSRQPKKQTVEIGQQAEQQACDYLIAEGLSFIDNNYHCPPGEIDLIMKHADTMVFVEVRYRKSSSHGGAAASISKQKCKRVRRSAEHYLQKHRLLDKCPIRFDVVAITGQQTNWISGAF